MRAPGERQEKAQPLGPVVRPGEYVKPSEEKMKAIEVERFERVQYDRVGGVDYLAGQRGIEPRTSGLTVRRSTD